MFLYFYEAKMLVGFNPHYAVYPCIEKCKDLNDEENNNDLRFDGWEREENEDGTFYLVFVLRSGTRYYLSDDGWTEHTKMYENSFLGQPFVFNGDTINIPNNGHILQPVKIHDEHHIVCMPERGGKSNVRLTTSSNINHSYVLK